MADLVFRSGGPHSVVTTVFQNRAGGFKLAELALHLPSGSVRLRFSDRASLSRFSSAVGDLAFHADNPAHGRPVHTRLYTDAPQAPPAPSTGRASARPLLIDPSLALPS